MGELAKTLSGGNDRPQPTDETDYLATATAAQAGKPETDLEIAAPVLTDPLTTSSSEQLIKECGWKRGQNRAREVDGYKPLNPYSDG